MQAIILAAGKGSRLGKYTNENTKCMLQLNDRTLVEQSLDTLDKAGIRKLTLVVGYKKENLQQFLGLKYKNIDIQYIENPVYDTTNNLYSLYLAKDVLLEDDTILLESDLIYDEAIVLGLVSDKRKNLAVVDRFKSWMDGTVVTLDSEDNITDFVPKSAFDFSEVDNYFKTVNIYKFSKEFSRDVYIPFLEAYSKAIGNHEYYEQVLRVISILDNKGLQGYRLESEKWYEIDDIQDKDNAEFIFSPTAKNKLRLAQQKFGGYWRYEELLDFCFLVNPYFPSERMKSEIKAYFDHLLTEYPSGLNVQNLLAGKMFGVDSDEIIVGNGAAELIKVLDKAVDGNFGVMIPTFNEYTACFGAERVVESSSKDDGFRYSIDELLKLAEKVDNLLLINPDNPSGNFISKENVLSLVRKLKAMDKKLILDESFVDFSNGGCGETLIDSAILSEFQNLIVVKSISKSYGVPGVRLGVLATSNQLVMAKLKKEMPIWNINSIAEYFLQIVGKYKLDYSNGCRQIRDERQRFYRKLSKIRFLKIFPSEANYFLCAVTVKYTATELAELLIDKDIFVKDLSHNNGFLNQEYLRISVRNSADNDILLEALRVLDN